jgi:serine/threonine-protein kinase
MLPLPGGAGLSPVLGSARRLADFTLPRGTFKRFELEQVVRLLLDVLSGLAALHEVVSDGEAFVHGNVSPQNIYIDEHGTARLVPLVKGASLDDAGYVAPERVTGGPIDARADVFSVGVMLWEALAGKRLFPNGVAARGADAPPPIRLAPDARWAAPLCGLAERAIALAPSARFASALELSNALAAAAAQRLANVDTDAWQEEAPTPVFQPRLHLAPLFSTTPPPSVITLPSEPVAPAVEAGQEARDSVEVVPASGRGRVAAWGVALLLGAAGFLALVAPSHWPSAVAAAAGASLPAFGAAARPAPTGAPLPAVLRAPAALSAPPAPASSAKAPLTPVVSATAPLAPAASASAASSAAAPVARPGHAKPPLAPRLHRDDYGI